jgi:hypothetical protein
VTTAASRKWFSDLISDAGPTFSTSTTSDLGMRLSTIAAKKVMMEATTARLELSRTVGCIRLAYMHIRLGITPASIRLTGGTDGLSHLLRLDTSEIDPRQSRDIHTRQGGLKFNNMIYGDQHTGL